MSQAAPVDVVIAVHTPTRPVARAVASVLEGNAPAARPVVVCHGVDIEAIAAQLPRAHRDRVHWLEHRDGAASPAGPFNAGMRASTARYVSLMGSDDTLQPGAVSRWLTLAEDAGAECVITRLRRGTGQRPVPTPPVRPRQRGLRDVVRDRLSYRSAPLGLVATAARERLGAELVEGLPVGEDVPYVTRLWCETRVAVDTRGPGYLIGEDALDRVTHVPRPLGAELAFVHHLLEAPWFAGYPQPVRTAVATKLLRIHVFGAVANRPDPGWWAEAERQELRVVTRALLRAAPEAAAPLSRADHRVVAAALDPGVAADELVARALARRRHGSALTLLPRDLRRLGHREAPPRFMAASLLAAR